jgi:hypothetical protein
VQGRVRDDYNVVPPLKINLGLPPFDLTERKCFGRHRRKKNYLGR